MSQNAPILVTGAAGFIGSNFVLDWIAKQSSPVISLDKLTYAGNLENLSALEGNKRHEFVRGDIGDRVLVAALLAKHRPRAIVNFAAETHVDRSILGPEEFIQTNALSTLRLLEAAREYWDALPGAEKSAFRIIHVSTDEVYGSLDENDPPSTETARFMPNSLYAASKAASDHIVRGLFRTHGLPVITTNSSNNYGPRQFPEKLIPLMIHHALSGQSLPVYGDGLQRRDWLYVTDHCAALRLVLEKGRIGEVYNIGGGAELTNIDVVRTLCDILDRSKLPRHVSYHARIAFVKDRPGHDRRYALDTVKISNELGWKPAESFKTGIEKTVRWYLDNSAWVAAATGRDYRDWIAKNYGDRA